MTGHRFAVVGFIPELAEPIRENLRSMGLTHRLTGFHYLPGGAQIVSSALSGDTARFLEAFAEVARQAIAGGANLLIPGEGLPNEILVHEGVNEIDGVPILDSDGLVVKTAEHLVSLARLGIHRRSTAGYWLRRPEPEYLDHLRGVFWG